MNPQQHLNDLFLSDTYRLWKERRNSATDTLIRLRLFIAATGYDKSLKEVFLSGGFGEEQYCYLLSCYDREFKKRMR